MVDPVARAREILGTVIDPEAGLSLIDLGLIYDVTVEGRRVHVLMTLTSEGCPVGPYLVDDAETRLRDAGDFDQIDIEITFDPPWTPSRISAEGRARLAE